MPLLLMGRSMGYAALPLMRRPAISRGLICNAYDAAPGTLTRRFMSAHSLAGSRALRHAYLLLSSHTSLTDPIHTLVPGIRPHLVRSGRVGSGQVGSGRVRFGQVRFGQVRYGVESEEVQRGYQALTTGAGGCGLTGTREEPHASSFSSVSAASKLNWY